MGRPKKSPKTPANSVVILLDDLNLDCTQKQLETCAELWEKGLPIEEIATQVRKERDLGKAIDETALMIMHLRRRGKIGTRERGVFGDRRIG